MGEGGFESAERERETHHIRRREITHNKLVRIRLDDLRHLIRYALHGHRRLFVVRRDFGRGDHVALFVLELFFDTAVEEESDVGVFLGLWILG